MRQLHATNGAAHDARYADTLPIDRVVHVQSPSSTAAAWARTVVTVLALFGLELADPRGLVGELHDLDVALARVETRVAHLEGAPPPEPTPAPRR